MKEQIVEVEMSELDYLITLRVRELRLSDKYKFSQQELSLKMGLAKSFVGKVESLNQSKKYSIRHLTLIAKAFGMSSMSELMNFPVPERDSIRIKFKLSWDESSSGKPKKRATEIISIRAQ